jgi:hypothetical protein
MMVNGIDISAFGFRLLKVKGLFSLPGRKRTLKYTGFDETDIVFDPRSVTVEVLGKFQDTGSLITGVNSLKTELLRGKIPFTFPNHNVSFEGWCERGMKVIVKKNVAHLTMEIRYNQ